MRDRYSRLMAGAVCAGLVIVADPDLMRTPFVWWALAGAGVLCAIAVMRPRVRGELYELAAWLYLFVVLSAAPLFATRVLSPRTIDASLSWGDFGVQRAMAQWAVSHRMAGKPLTVVYNLLPVAAALVVGWSEEPRRVAKVLLLAGLAALPLYLALPATGPGFVHSRWAPRNAMPSLHMAWALLLVHFSKRRWRWVAALFAAATAVSTLTTGQHYAIDLVAAALYAWFFVWVTQPAESGGKARISSYKLKAIQLGAEGGPWARASGAVSMSVATEGEAKSSADGGHP